MEILKFTLGGPFATFTSPYSNTRFFTYSHIHKLSVLGILGAIIGIDRGGQGDNPAYRLPKFYRELRNLKIAIVPAMANFPQVDSVKTETSGMMNKDSEGYGATYLTYYKRLVKPSWDIYVMGNDNPHFERIKEYILDGKCKFLPYLGFNHNFADITNKELLEGEEAEEILKIDSLFEGECVATEEGEDEYDRIYFEEYMPVKYHEELIQYVEKKLVLTNDSVVECTACDRVLKCDDRTLYFI